VFGTVGVPFCQRTEGSAGECFHALRRGHCRSRLRGVDPGCLVGRVEAGMGVNASVSAGVCRRRICQGERGDSHPLPGAEIGRQPSDDHRRVGGRRHRLLAGRGRAHLHLCPERRHGTGGGREEPEGFVVADGDETGDGASGGRAKAAGGSHRGAPHRGSRADPAGKPHSRGRQGD